MIYAMCSNELHEQALSSIPCEPPRGAPSLKRECPYCKTMYSYSNLSSHVKRCKVRVGINIVAKDNDLVNLRKENDELRMQRDNWMLRYEEVKTMNDQLIEVHGPRKGVIPMTARNIGHPSIVMMD